ncbi:MAG: hypothetical protein EOO63_01040 [Hymenobacter sp.]|nr:MAG: hypothetical protein EOO63_01040 [Hymenobacter sp.]
MTSEEVDYLIKHYSHLLTGKEQAAYKHLLHDEKLAANDNLETRERMRAMLLRVGWLSKSPEVLTLLEKGVPAFRRLIASKLYAEHGEKNLFVRCSHCQRLTRTPLAKQCRHCSNDWH